MFQGFPPQAADFLWRLRLNNSKEWFLANKEEYEQVYQTPMKELAQGLLDFLQQAYPKRSWRLHLSRIYRDARRLHGQGPLKDHLWFTLFADSGNDVTRPCFYFEFTPESIGYGLGCWSPNASLMQAFRKQVAENPAQAEQLARQLARQDELVVFGELYKKHREPLHPTLQPWIDRKNLGFGTERPHDDRSFSPELPRRLQEALRLLMPLHDYFTALSDQSGKDEHL